MIRSASAKCISPGSQAGDRRLIAVGDAAVCSGPEIIQMDRRTSSDWLTRALAVQRLSFRSQPKRSRAVDMEPIDNDDPAFVQGLLQSCAHKTTSISSPIACSLTAIL